MREISTRLGKSPWYPLIGVLIFTGAAVLTAGLAGGS